MISKELASQPFSYQSLDIDKPQIRILCVEGPSSDLGLVRCRFEVIELPDDGGNVPPYEAISYCWGTDAEREDIEIDDQVLSVPVNTAKALSWLCHRHGHRRVWIDAVCINQQDLAEKNQQVARMRWVYLHARKVLIWLGDHECGGSSPLDRINDAAALIKPELVPDWNKPGAQLEIAEATYLSEIVNKVDEQIDWAAIHELLAMEWFRRAWVMQESWLAQEAVYYLRSSASAWENVALLAFLLPMKAQRNGDSVKQMNPSWFYSIIRPRDIQAKGENLRSLLTSANGLLCSRSHDVIYALLGLRRPEAQHPDSPSHVPVDYSRPILEVHAQATKACIIEDRTLFFLDATVRPQHHHDGTHNEGAPSSWVLPLSADRKNQVTLDYLRSFAHAGTCMQIGDTADVLILEVQGVVVDRVARVIQRPTLPCSPRDPIVEARFPFIRQLMDAMDIAQHYLRSCKESLPAWDDSESMDGFAALWSMDQSIHQRFPDKITSEEFRNRWKDTFTNLLSAKLLLAIIKVFDNAAPASESFISTIQDVSKCIGVVESLSRRFDLFVTEAGRLGAGSRYVKAGDEVCIIFGEGLPVLLRSDIECWNWVGSSFLDELADVGACLDLIFGNY